MKDMQFNEFELSFTDDDKIESCSGKLVLFSIPTARYEKLLRIASDLLCKDSDIPALRFESEEENEGNFVYRFCIHESDFDSKDNRPLEIIHHLQWVREQLDEKLKLVNQARLINERLAEIDNTKKEGK